MPRAALPAPGFLLGLARPLGGFSGNTERFGVVPDCSADDVAFGQSLEIGEGQKQRPVLVVERHCYVGRSLVGFGHSSTAKAPRAGAGGAGLGRLSQGRRTR